MMGIKGLDIIFGNALRKAWQNESKKATFSEVQQFKALMDSFASLKGQFRIEEFHGVKHQVIFNGHGSWGRPSARCEISDLLIVSYRKIPTFEARATFLQAKKSNEKHKGLCGNTSKKVGFTSFKANLEQWDLLSRRPNVLPYPPFVCHPDILSGAILPSVGSIGVFHKIKGKVTDFFYMSADVAKPLSSPKRKYAKLTTTNVNRLRNFMGYDERTFTCCIETFGQALFNMEIGTPIHHESALSSSDETYRIGFRGWLWSVIARHNQIDPSDSSMVRDLMRQLESTIESRFVSETPNVLLINCDDVG